MQCVGYQHQLCVLAVGLLCLFCLSYRLASFPLALYVAGEEVLLRGKGRHDPCVLPRAIPIVEAMVALVLLDALMEHTAQCSLFANRESSDVIQMWRMVNTNK